MELRRAQIYLQNAIRQLMGYLPRKASSEIRSLLAHNVKRLRQLRGLTQHALAQHCGYKKSYIGNVELATQNVTLAALETLARGLGCSPFELLQPITRSLTAIQSGSLSCSNTNSDIESGAGSKC